MHLFRSSAILGALPVVLLSSCTTAATATRPASVAPAPPASSVEPTGPSDSLACDGEDCADDTERDAASGAPMADLAGDPADGPTEFDSASKDALQRCQHAQELLDAGNTAGALSEVDLAYEALLSADPGGDPDNEQAAQDIRLLAAGLIQHAYGVVPRADSAPATAPWDLGLEMVDNEYVQREIRSMTTVERQQFIDGYRRSGRYRAIILKKLEDAGLPSQLAWLPLVESWFKVKALSRASALGLWQFISSTGLRYGLKRDRYIDERLDPEKSTDAAISYLSDLHQLFGAWPKALAAYNCGEGAIKRLQGRSPDEFVGFWDFYQLLPVETRRYVPRLIAAVQIIQDPEKYGMELPEPEAPIEDVARVEINKPVKLSVIDKTLSLPEGTISSLNPELRHAATPDHAYQLRVPATAADTLAAAIAKLPKWDPPQIEYVVHRVHHGDTLSGIADRYHTSISAIMRTNRLRSANRIWPGQRLRIPVRR